MPWQEATSIAELDRGPALFRPRQAIDLVRRDFDAEPA